MIQYGTGHGKDGNGKGLTARHARLCVGAAATLVHGGALETSDPANAGERRLPPYYPLLLTIADQRQKRVKNDFRIPADT